MTPARRTRHTGSWLLVAGAGLLLTIPLGAQELLLEPDFSEDLALVHGLLEMGLVERAEQTLGAIEAPEQEQQDRKDKASIAILEARWRYERDVLVKNKIFEAIKQRWQGYLSQNPGDLDGRFQYVKLLLDHADISTEQSAREPAEEAQALLSAASSDLEEADQLIQKTITEARTTPDVVDEDNALLMKALYYEIEIGYARGLVHPVGSEERLTAYQPFLEGKIEDFAWTYENYITGYYALLLWGKMLQALERYATAISVYQGVLGLPPEELAATSLRLQCYARIADCYIQAGDPSSAVQAVDQMLQEYGAVWEYPWGERALVQKSIGLANSNRPAEAVELLSEIIQREGPGKGPAQEALTYVRNRYPEGIQLSCEVLARASEGAVRKARFSEETTDWYDAIRALQEACDACLDDRSMLKDYGAQALMNLGHSLAQLDRPYEAALAYERGARAVHPYWGEAGWNEDLDAADFLYYAYVNWKKLGGLNRDFAGKGQETRDRLATTYPDSEQVKELTYYIARELMSDGHDLRLQNRFDDSASRLREALDRFAEVQRTSRKYESSLFLIARCRYELVTCLMDQQKIRGGRDDLPPPLEQEAAAAVQAFESYATYLKTAPPAISDNIVQERAYNARWTAFYLGRLAHYRKDFETAVRFYQEAKTEEELSFSAKCDYFSILALLAAERAPDAEASYELMQSTYGVTNPQVSKAALALAKHFDLLYLELSGKGQEREAQEVELRSAVYFYDFAQSGAATAENLLNISQKFLKVADDYREAGDSEEAEGMYRRAVWCINQYLEKSEDTTQRETVLEQRAWIQYYLGDEEEALGVFQQLMEEDPDRADVRLALAWCLVALEDYQDALGHFEAIESGLERFSRGWQLARYGIAWCLARKNPTPEEVNQAKASSMKPSRYLGERGLVMIRDMRELMTLGETQEGKTIYFRDPEDQRRRVRPLKDLWQQVEHLLRKRK